LLDNVACEAVRTMRRACQSTCRANATYARCDPACDYLRLLRLSPPPGLAAAPGVRQRGGGARHLQPGGRPAERLPGLHPRGPAAVRRVSGRAGRRGPRAAGPVPEPRPRRPQHLRGTETTGQVHCICIALNHSYSLKVLYGPYDYIS